MAHFSERTSRSEPSARSKGRASSEGTVWFSVQDRLIAAGTLVNLSEGGLRYRHDFRALGPDGFPLPAPAVGQALQLAVTLRPGAARPLLHAQAIRALRATDGGVEVAVRFAAQSVPEALQIRRQYVDATLQRTRRNLATSRARLFQETGPARKRREPLGKILSRNRALDRTDLEEFLHGNRAGVPLGARLVKAGVVSGRQLAEALGEHVGLPFVDLEAVGVDPVALRAIRPGTALRLGAVAFVRDGQRLKVAAPRPLSVEERALMESQTRLHIQVFLADPEQIARVLGGARAGRTRRTRHAAPAELHARYRFYSPTWQPLDGKAFKGAVVNLSETGILIHGPAPRALAGGVQKKTVPRAWLAVLIPNGTAAESSMLRFELVRMSLEVPLEEASPDAGGAGTLVCWIGARIAPLVPEDRMSLRKLCENLMSRARQATPEAPE